MHAKQNRKSSTEPNKQTSAATLTFNKLDLFGIHGSCPTTFEIHVVDAVIRSNVLHGMESVQLKETALKLLELCQFEALRKV